MKLSTVILCVGLALPLFFACKHSSQPPAELLDNGTVTTDTLSNVQDDLNKSKTIVYTLPAPVEMASVIGETGVRFDDQILNDLGAATKYASNRQMAINLGIYAMDMSISGMFNRSQKMVEYFSLIKDLTKNLGIEKVLDENAIKKLEGAEVTKEDLLNVISEIYMNTNQYLIENNRRNISTLVMAGGWIEGLYLALSYFDPNHVQLKIVQRIVAQKLTLVTMFNIIDSMDPKGTDEDLLYVRGKLEEIKAIFDFISIKHEGNVSAITDYDTKTTRIVAKPSTQVDIDILLQFKAKVFEVRNEFVK